MRLSFQACASLSSYAGKHKKARWWWLTPVILAIQEAQIRRIMV
jgi:hypothetical protein